MTSTLEVPQKGTTRPAPARFVAADHHNDGKKHLLLAASGSVATIKLPNIIQALSRHAPNLLSIRILLTRSALQFLQGQSAEQPTYESLLTAPNVDGIHLDEDEWAKPWVRGDAILHIELRRWADLMVIAPLSANTMAKIVGGLSDNLLCSVVRAWDATGEVEGITTTVPGGAVSKKVIVVAPAMNTAMWRHPVTRKQIKVLEEEWGVREDGWFEVLRPIEKELACGDVGDGAMKDWREIVQVIEVKLSLA
ncbi:MAG: swr complex subunit [Chaenotheca gracillima]|nr:MAG: swr complex subunit [Chaenotheca gracillima]